MARPRAETVHRRELVRALKIDAATVARDLEQAISGMSEAADPLTAATWDPNPVRNGTDAHSDPTASVAVADADRTPPVAPGEHAQNRARARADYDTAHKLAQRITRDLSALSRVLGRYVRTCPDCGDPLGRFDGMFCKLDADYRNAHGRRMSAARVENRLRMRRARSKL